MLRFVVGVVERPVRACKPGTEFPTFRGQRRLPTPHAHIPRTTLAGQPVPSHSLRRPLPQIIALTTLLASPYWQSAAQRQWPEPTEFINQVRRSIAPHYRWNLRRHHGVRDPLTELIAEQRASGQSAFTTRITTATRR